MQQEIMAFFAYCIGNGVYWGTLLLNSMAGWVSERSQQFEFVALTELLTMLSSYGCQLTSLTQAS